jgi:AraC-like DNA-binding protein
MYQTALPTPALRNYVSCFWEGELTINHNQAHTYHAMATSKVEWLFCYAGKYSTNNANGQQVQVPAVCFYGQTNTCKQYVSTDAANAIFGVRLYAHAIPLLFNIPATELTNQYVDISSLLNNRGSELADEILQANTFEERVAIISAFLVSQIQNRLSTLNRFEAFITTMNQVGMSVSDLSNQVNLSQRQFERHFKYLTGFSAKTFFKISRFEGLVEALCYGAGNTPKNLTNMALEHGYYDQSHLNRHFKEFTGMSPSGYLQLQGQLAG